MTNNAKKGLLKDLARWVGRRDECLKEISWKQEDIERHQGNIERQSAEAKEAQEVIAEYARVWGLTEEMAKEAAKG
jgi:hypothetical protein